MVLGLSVEYLSFKDLSFNMRDYTFIDTRHVKHPTFFMAVTTDARRLKIALLDTFITENRLDMSGLQKPDTGRKRCLQVHVHLRLDGSVAGGFLDFASDYQAELYWANEMLKRRRQTK
eukprot:scaffold11203_cov64-Cylindrotheca_fusiformis.AAC.1